jgi:hypothetical protein
MTPCSAKEPKKELLGFHDRLRPSLAQFQCEGVSWACMCTTQGGSAKNVVSIAPCLGELLRLMRAQQVLP